jgi:hypothetical protein
VVEPGEEAPLRPCTVGDWADDVSSVPLPQSPLCQLKLLWGLLFATTVTHDTVASFCLWLFAVMMARPEPLGLVFCVFRAAEVLLDGVMLQRLVALR